MSQARLSKSLWAEAVATATYLRNRMVTTALKNGLTPYQMWSGKKPDLSNIRTFGCIVYSHIPEGERRKLDMKANKLRFVGYTESTSNYKVWDEVKRRCYVRHDLIFNEGDFGETNDVVEKEVENEESIGTIPTSDNRQREDPSQEEQSSEQQPLLPQHEDSLPQSQPESSNETQPEPRRSERSRKPPTRYGRDDFADKACHFAHQAVKIEEPLTIEEALSSNYSKEWKEATDAEYASLLENHTWDLVELPEGRRAIGCKWVLKLKYDSQGNVDRFKGRLVAQGYSQKHGIDYEETFSPVAHFSSIRTVLAYAVEKRMKIHQMDVVTAFLNGDLTEDIYMQQPPGYVNKGNERLVCKLRKSLYGLKQSPRCWNSKFTQHAKRLGFKESGADPCIFTRKRNEKVEIIAIYVDDLIVITETDEEMKHLKQSLSKEFKMKDLGELHYCLGIHVHRCEDGISLCQTQYIQKIIDKYGLSDANVVSTPMDPSVKLQKDDGLSKKVDPVRYQSMVGSILHASRATRPDIANAIAIVSKYNATPTEAHMTAVKRILRYLKGTISFSLKYTATGQKMKGYTDADWANDLDNRHSTSGNVFLMAGGAISWLSQKQTTVALSTSEAEYMALGSATQEAIWLRRLLSDLNVDIQDPTEIKEDNQGTIAMSKNPVGYKRTKHIDIKYHFVREAVQEESIHVTYCPTNDMLADILTKPLPKSRFEKLRDGLGLGNYQTTNRGGV